MPFPDDAEPIQAQTPKIIQWLACVNCNTFLEGSLNHGTQGMEWRHGNANPSCPNYGSVFRIKDDEVFGSSV